MHRIFSNSALYLMATLITSTATSCSSFPRFFFAPKAPEVVNSIADVENYISHNIEFGTPPGLSLVVVKDDQIVYHKAFGKDLDTPITDQSVFHWWSVTKVFTAISVLQLCEKGLIDLDAPIRSYLTDFAVRSPSSEGDSNAITVRQILSHSSGIRDAMPQMMSWLHYSQEDHINQTELLQKIWPQYNGLASRPGAEGRYSNLAYIVLGALIEKVSGLPYEEYVEQNVLKPLNMNASGFSYSQTMRQNRIHGSHPIDGPGRSASASLDMGKALHSTRNDTWWFNELYTDYTPPSGLLSSTSDVAEFLKFYLSDESSNVLSNQSKVLMAKPLIKVTESPAPVDHLQFGLSWFVMNLDGAGTRQAIVHGGNGMSQVAFVGLIPDENLGIAIVANSTYLGTDFGVSLFTMLSQLEW